MAKTSKSFTEARFDTQTGRLRVIDPNGHLLQLTEPTFTEAVKRCKKLGAEWGATIQLMGAGHCEPQFERKIHTR